MRCKQLFSFSLTFLFITIVSATSKGEDAEEYSLVILHNNDIHSRFIAANNYGEDCENSTNEKCFGGIPRILYLVDHIRDKTENVLFLNAGDNFVGTLWYQVFRWQLWAEVLAYLKYDAISFGNHEFDNGVDGLYEYVKNVSSHTPVLACNVDASEEPKLKGTFEKSVVTEKGGRRIGLIGYVLPETVQLSSPGPTLKFTDEISCIRSEAERLVQEGIDIIIAVGHSGHDMDKRIAEEVPHVDVVVGGHSNTFLYNGNAPSNEKPADSYPVVIEHSDGRRTLVVQAYAYGKYLGFLDIRFDKDGNITQYAGNPILLESKLPEDTTMKQLLAPKYEEIKKKFEEKIGDAEVVLDGNCRRKECNLGNLFTDAMIEYANKHRRTMFQDRKEPFYLAILNSGTIRTSISNGSITLKNAVHVHPFGNTISVVDLDGKTLREVFEHSVAAYDPASTKDATGQLLQVSGFRVKYNVSNPVGQRVTKVLVKCMNCNGRRYQPVKPGETYAVLATDFMSRGGDLYSMLPSQETFVSEALIIDALIDYIKEHSPVSAKVEKRSKFN